MKVLILGGTGAMGKSLVEILSKDKKNTIFVTSRKERNSSGNTIYLKGDAHDNIFLENILKNNVDVIVDFMSYKTDEFSKRVDLLVKNVKQYIFISSSRVYAKCKLINENSDRLLNVIDDNIYLSTDEYALTKARQENILKQSQKKNWTIIRPYITYNDNRLQLGVYEKEVWLNRILNGNTLVIPEELLSKKTTLTSGKDVAYAISKLILNDNALGQCIHIAKPNSNTTWNDIITIYASALKEEFNIELKLKVINNRKMINHLVAPYYYQYYYDRCYDRIFDGSNLEKIINEKINYKDELKESLIIFLNNKTKMPLDSRTSAIMDKICKEKTSLNSFQSLKSKIKYLLIRYTPFYYIEKYILCKKYY